MLRVVLCALAVMAATPVFADSVHTSMGVGVIVLPSSPPPVQPAPAGPAPDGRTGH